MRKKLTSLQQTLLEENWELAELRRISIVIGRLKHINETYREAFINNLNYMRDSIKYTQKEREEKISGKKKYEKTNKKID